MSNPQKDVYFATCAPDREDVARAIEKAVDGLCLDASLWKSGKVLIKVNCVSAFTTPGTNTSPWVLDGVLKVLRSRMPDAQLDVADSDSSARVHVKKGFELWGYEEICPLHGARLLNLSDYGWVTKDLGVKAFPEIQVSSILDEYDLIISVPVMKTHTWSAGSCTMKNLYGFLGPQKHCYHTHLDEVICALQKNFPPCSALWTEQWDLNAAARFWDIPARWA